MNTPTLDQLKRGLNIAEKIAALEAEMAALLQGQPISSSATMKGSASSPKKRKKGKLSPEGIARIIAAQKKRWARVKAGKKAAVASKKLGPKKPQAPKFPEKKKRTLSPEARAKLAEAMKARWAAAKASGGPAPTAKKE